MFSIFVRWVERGGCACVSVRASEESVYFSIGSVK